jgi:voltage-gated potassium channel
MGRNDDRMNAMSVGEKTRVERWEHRTEWPLAAVAIAFLVVYSIQVLVRPPGPVYNFLRWVDLALYLAFVVDYFARLVLAENRLHWFVRHLLDFAIVTLPFLRPLRILRLVVLIEVLEKAFGDALRGRIVLYTAFSSVLLVYSSSLAVLDAERHVAHANIKNFGDALWWSVTTITTVGYGDYQPISFTGRIVAVLLMIGGISLLGMITATVAAWIVQRVAAKDTALEAATAAHIHELRADIAQLTSLVEQLRDDADARRQSPVGE